MSKTIITVATTGAWPTKENNPNIPLTPHEIADEVYECYEAGAAVAHIHVRDDAGKPTMDLEKFSLTQKLIKEKCDILLNMTTSGSLDATDEERQLHIKKLKPELASFDCGSMNWMHHNVFLNHPYFLSALANTMFESGVKPEIEIFDTGMVSESIYYLKKGDLKAPLHYQFVLGVAGGMEATIENLVYLKNMIPEGSTWGALGIGKAHIPILLAAVAMGGHVRVGMEDNVYYGPGILAESNVQLVSRAAEIIKASSNKVATPDEARKILGLK